MRPVGAVSARIGPPAGRRAAPAVASVGTLAHTDPVLVSSYHYLEGPLIALAALGVLLLICRWVFSTDHRVPPAQPPGAAPDYGLLESVAVARTREDADLLRTVLVGAGIRASVTPTDGGHVVLVFRSDAPAARQLVSSG